MDNKILNTIYRIDITSPLSPSRLKKTKSENIFQYLIRIYYKKYITNYHLLVFN